MLISLNFYDKVSWVGKNERPGHLKKGSTQSRQFGSPTTFLSHIPSQSVRNEYLDIEPVKIKVVETELLKK